MYCFYGIFFIHATICKRIYKGRSSGNCRNCKNKRFIKNLKVPYPVLKIIMPDKNSGFIPFTIRAVKGSMGIYACGRKPWAI